MENYKIENTVELNSDNLIKKGYRLPIDITFVMNNEEFYLTKPVQTIFGYTTCFVVDCNGNYAKYEGCNDIESCVKSIVWFRQYNK